MQRLRCLVRKEFLELRMNPRLFGLVVDRADPPADDARLCGDDRREGCAAASWPMATDRRPAASSSPASMPRRTSASSTPSRPSARSNRTSSGGRRGWRCRSRAATRSDDSRSAAGDSAGRRRRHRLELDDRRARLCEQPRSAATPRNCWASGTERTCGRAGRDRRAHPRLVQPAAREPRFFMIPGVLALILLIITANLAAMAIVREKELGTLEQLNVTPLAAMGADRRQAAAVRLDRLDRRPAGRRGRGVLVRGAAARQLRAAVRHVPRLRALHARRSACSSRRSPIRSSRR